MEMRSFLLSILGRLLLAAAFSAFAYWKMGGAVAAILSIPLWGVLLAKPIIVGVAAYFDSARKQPYAPWQGRYYEFQGTHIRIDEVDGQLWFCDADVLQVLGQKPSTAMKIAYADADYRTMEASGLMAFSEAAVVRVISRIRHPEAGKFRFWIEREVIAPHHKRREMAGLPPSAQ